MDHGEKAARRMLAGLCVEQKLADRATIDRWQKAVQDGAFDPDMCAEEILEKVGPKVGQSAELLARAGGLERDFLMMSQQTGLRGASRQVRRAGKGFMAVLVMNLIAISAYSLIIGAILVLLRHLYGWSYDGAIDNMVESVRNMF